MIKDFHDIKEFIVLAKELNYQEASERLYISPSTLSKHIAGLEKSLGVALFDRTTRSVTLTKYGQTFLGYAEKMIETYDECSEALNELKVDADHHLKVGFLSRLEQCGIIEVLSEFPSRYPGISIEMLPTISPLDLLSSGKCDFVFDTDSHPDEVKSLLFKKDNLVAVLPHGHELENREFIELSWLSREKFIVHRDTFNDPAGLDVGKLCEEAGFKPNIIMDASYTSTIVKLVRQGQGIAVINKMNVPAQLLSTVATVDISPIVPCYIYLLYPKKGSMTIAATKFLKHIKDSI